jgi:hypothetical protein
MKNRGKNKKNCVLHNKEKRKTLEKNPQKGGTPAIENKETIKTFEKKLEAPKSKNE